MEELKPPSQRNFAFFGPVWQLLDGLAPPTLAEVKGTPYLPCVGASIAKRLILILTAVAFVFATALPIGAMSMPDAAAMTGGTENPCSDCPDKAPVSGDVTKMACGALACAGVAIGLPARQAPYLPAFARHAYPTKAVLEPVGASPTPEPFPPRPTVLV